MKLSPEKYDQEWEKLTTEQTKRDTFLLLRSFKPHNRGHKVLFNIESSGEAFDLYAVELVHYKMIIQMYNQYPNNYLRKYNLKLTLTCDAEVDGADSMDGTCVVEGGI